MGILDPRMMYRAGFARGHKGRNTEVEARLARQERLVNFAYEVVGNVAVDAIQDGFQSLQKFRDQLESQSSAGLTKVEKLPRENTALRQSIIDISNNYRKANRRAHLSFGKKRRQARAERNKWMTQMTDLNAALEQYQIGAKESQGFARVAAGIAGENNKEGNVNLSAGNQGFENQNTLEQASGEMAQLLRWNIDKGYMEVIRGGKWVKDASGKDVYVDKGIENNKKLKKEYEAFVKDKPEGFTVPSYQQWAQTNYPNATTLRSDKYSDLKFGKGEDNTMRTDLTNFKDVMTTSAYKTNAVPWHLIAKNKKTQFVGKINSYSDAAFRDFYFGGYAYDYSSNKMNETAPAYQELLGTYNEKGELISGRGLTPGTTEWEGALTTLKAQSMVKGSTFRQKVAEDEWKNMEKAYMDAQAEFAKLQAEKDRKALERARTSQGKNINYYNIKGSQVAKEQVDPVVNIFNSATDETIIPSQTVTWLDDSEGNSIEFGKDENGWYLIRPQYKIDDQGRKIMTNKVRYNGTKDEVAAGLGINSTSLGYNFPKQSTPVTTSTYTPPKDVTSAADMKEKLDLITLLQGAFPDGVGAYRSFDQLDLKTLRKIQKNYVDKLAEDIKPSPF